MDNQNKQKPYILKVFEDQDTEEIIISNKEYYDNSTKESLEKKINKLLTKIELLNIKTSILSVLGKTETFMKSFYKTNAAHDELDKWQSKLDNFEIELAYLISHNIVNPINAGFDRDYINNLLLKELSRYTNESKFYHYNDYKLKP